MSRKLEKISVLDRNIEELSRLSTADQLDVKYILLLQFLALSELLRNPEVDESIIETHILGLNALIPESLKDDQFREDSANSVISIPFDRRLEWCGKKVGSPKCSNLGKGSCKGCSRIEGCSEKKDTLNPIMLLNAITNLFDRCGLWLKKSPKTVFRGKRYGDRQQSDSET